MTSRIAPRTHQTNQSGCVFSNILLASRRKATFRVRRVRSNQVSKAKILIQGFFKGLIGVLRRH